MIRVSKLRNICSGYRAIEGRESKKEVRIQMTDREFDVFRNNAKKTEILLENEAEEDLANIVYV